MGENNKNSMQILWDSSMLDAGSAAWLESLYENFLRNPNDVDPHWRDYFSTLPRVNGVAVQEVPHDEVREQFRKLTQRKGGLQAAPSAQAASLASTWPRPGFPSDWYRLTAWGRKSASSSSNISGQIAQ